MSEPRKVSDIEVAKLIPREELEKALTFNKDFHWGIEPSKAFVLSKKEFPLLFEFPKTVSMLGYLRALVYQTKKKGDSGQVWYVHAHDHPFPILACDPSGKQLYIVGGIAEVKDRGIIH